MTALDPPGPVLAGRYRLGRLLGRGGTADVHVAVDERTGAQVAVKVLRHPEDLDADRRGAEVRALSRLRHPNLVELLDAGTAQGRDFLVMELVDGPTLRWACAGGPLPAARVAQVGAAVAEGLRCVHAHGVVHRDVKPDNVLLGPGHRVRVADFGIARILSATRVTATGMTVGTAAYLAPEQVTGGAVGTAADVYALGLLLLEALTGRREYDGSPLEAALARLHRRPRIPTDLPAGWSRLLAAMTADDPAARPAAGAVAAALRPLTTPGTPPTAADADRGVGDRVGAGVPVARGVPARAPRGRLRRCVLAAAAALVTTAGVSLALHGTGASAPAAQRAAPRAVDPPATAPAAVPAAVPALPAPSASAGDGSAVPAAGAQDAAGGAGRSTAAPGAPTTGPSAGPGAPGAAPAPPPGGGPSGTAGGSDRTAVVSAAHLARAASHGAAPTAPSSADGHGSADRGSSGGTSAHHGGGGESGGDGQPHTT